MNDNYLTKTTFQDIVNVFNIKRIHIYVDIYTNKIIASMIVQSVSINLYVPLKLILVSLVVVQ